MVDSSSVQSANAAEQLSLDSMIDAQHARAPRNRHNSLHSIRRLRSQVRRRNHNVLHTYNYFLDAQKRILGGLRSVRTVRKSDSCSSLGCLFTHQPVRRSQHLSTNARSKPFSHVISETGLIFTAFTLRDNRPQCHSHHTHPQFCPQFCLVETGLRATRHQCCPCNHHGAESATWFVEP